jgi:hypothetical protein
MYVQAGDFIPEVGVLLAGQQSPGLAVAGGEWILIVYPGVSGVCMGYAPGDGDRRDLNVVEYPTPTCLHGYRGSTLAASLS